MGLLEDQIKRFLLQESKSTTHKRKRLLASNPRLDKTTLTAQRDGIDVEGKSKAGPAKQWSDQHHTVQDSVPLANYEQERAAFASQRDELLRDHPGKFVVFVGTDMIGLYNDLPTAVTEARKRFGRRPIYTKRLVLDDSSR